MSQTLSPSVARCSSATLTACGLDRAWRRLANDKQTASSALPRVSATNQPRALYAR